MVSRALRIFGLLLLSSGAAAAHGDGHRLHRSPSERSLGSSGWAELLSSQHRSGPTRERDATGRVWSHVELGGARTARGWTTQRLGSWSYSYASDGTHCVSQRTAESVLIRCQ